MEMPRIVVFGEALTDIVQSSPGEWTSYPGGAPWNVARGLSRLGVSCAFAGAVSTDALGDQLIRESISAGLPQQYIQRVNADPLVAIVPSKHPPRYFFAGEADLHFDPEKLPAGWLDAAQVCHFSCISLARKPLAATLVGLALDAKAAGKRISFDPNWRNLMDDDYREGVFPTMAALADDIKLSDEDLLQLFPGLGEARALDAIRTLNPEASILYTRGARGLALYTPDGSFEQPAIPIKVSDTVGAGDSCMAGWLASSLAHHDHVEHRLLFAAACASVSCRHAGAYAPTVSEVAELIETAVKR